MIKDDFNDLIDHGKIKNYLLKYLHLREEKFGQITHEEEIVEKETANLLSESFYTYSNIIQYAELNNVSLQIALHEYMFKLIYLIGSNLREIFENSIDLNKYNDPDEYMKYLIEKYSISKSEEYILSFQWFNDIELFFNNLSTRDYHIRVYNENLITILFQIEDKQQNIQLNLDQNLCNENNLVISKYYFFTELMLILSFFKIYINILFKEGWKEINDYQFDHFFNEAIDTFIQNGEEFIQKDSK